MQAIHIFPRESYDVCWEKLRAASPLSHYHGEKEEWKKFTAGVYIPKCGHV
jgi:hypothetical protein